MIEIDGKKYFLSADLVNSIKSEIENQEVITKVMDRGVIGDTYYFIDTYGRVTKFEEYQFPVNQIHYEIANYCRDKDLMTQRALYEELDRLLWRYSIISDTGVRYIGKPWWRIVYDNCLKRFDVLESYDVSSNQVYFDNRDAAFQAIEEIVKPFMEKHPDFIFGHRR